MAATAERVILASASTARARMLEAVGVTFTIEPAAIDEARIKTAAHEAGQAAIACALALAAGKARTVSRRHPEALVIGADVFFTSWRNRLAALRETVNRTYSTNLLMRPRVTGAGRSSTITTGSAGPRRIPIPPDTGRSASKAGSRDRWRT